MFEEGVEVVLFLVLSGFQALLGVFGLVVGGVSIHETRIVNNVCTLRPEFFDEEIPLWLSLVLPFVHGATCEYFGVLTNVRGGGFLARKVGDPITELVVIRCDESYLLAVKGAEDIKCRATSILMIR